MKLSDFVSYELGNIEGFDPNIEAQIVGRAEQLEADNAALQKQVEAWSIFRHQVESYCSLTIGKSPDLLWVHERMNEALEAGGDEDPMASPDATWEELGRGFIEQEPDYSEGGE